MIIYMKTFIKYTGIVLAASMALTSCEKSLDRFPLDKLSPETFLTNEKEMRIYSDAFYPMFPAAADLYAEKSDALIGTDLSLAIARMRVYETSMSVLHDSSAHISTSKK